MSEIDRTRKTFAALADATRLRLFALCARSEFSVSDLTSILDQSQPRISRHLKLLTEAGLLERFREGHFVYCRAPRHGAQAAIVRQLEALLPAQSKILELDAKRARSQSNVRHVTASDTQREFNQALIEFAAAKPTGRLLDMGSGTGRILTVLGARATEAIGIERDARRREESRSRLRFAGLSNCSIREGDVSRLSFADGSFDTVVVDDVLVRDAEPERVLAEACRVVTGHGRVLIIVAAERYSHVDSCKAQLSEWAVGSLTLAAPRAVPALNPEFFLFVATPSGLARDVA